MIDLVQEKKNCSGCAACINICPSDAIHMKEDEYGFYYPQVDKEKCVQCGACLKVCSYHRPQKEAESVAAYAAAAKEDEVILSSASGGIFSGIALEVIKGGGTVFGCSLEKKENRFVPMHIKVTCLEDLSKLQGSKYVQSNIGFIYREVKKELLSGKDVLFSGTPCQIAALKNYLNGKMFNNLFLIDIICHGVPNSLFFNEYIQILEKDLRGKITEFLFRDKCNGWGLCGSVKYIRNKDKKIHYKKIMPGLSSYYKMFLDYEIFRESCYSCEYANEVREGDLTIGDFWGISNSHPEYLSCYGGKMDLKKGVSCVLVNTLQGKRLIDLYGKNILWQASELKKIAVENEQLKHPGKKGNNRELILNMFVAEGYKAVEQWFKKRLGIKKYLLHIWGILPEQCKKAIRTIVR